MTPFGIGLMCKGVCACWLSDREAIRIETRVGLDTDWVNRHNCGIAKLDRCGREQS